MIHAEGRITKFCLRNPLISDPWFRFYGVNSLPLPGDGDFVPQQNNIGKKEEKPIKVYRTNLSFVTRLNSISKEIRSPERSIELELQLCQKLHIGNWDKN